MAEGRMLKKEISDSKKLGRLKSDRPRVLYFMMLPHLDRDGRLKADPCQIKGQVCTMLHYSADSIQNALEQLHEVGLLVLYQAKGNQYVQYTRFNDFQTFNYDRESESKIPAPNPENSGVIQRTPLKLREVKLREENNICTELFNKFWKSYPRKDAKQRVVRWFDKYQPSEIDVGKMIYTIERQKKKGQRLCCKRQYMPLPETWLNDGDWRDAPTEAEVKQQSEEMATVEQQAIEKEKEKMRQWPPSVMLRGMTTDELNNILVSKDIQVKRKYLCLHWYIKELLAEKKG